MKLDRLFMEAAVASRRHHVYSAARLKYEDSPVWRGRGCFPGGLLDCLNIDSNQQLVVQTGGAGLLLYHYKPDSSKVKNI